MHSAIKSPGLRFSLLLSIACLQLGAPLMLLCHVFFVDQIDGNWDIKSQKIIKAAAESAADIAKP